MTAVYASILALSAFLVFWIQPLVARMLLPVLGGSPSVWNTCVFFFQAMLLAGYLYTHGLTRLSLRRQALVHATLFVIVIIVLPASPGGWAPSVGESNSLWLLGQLLVFLGLPFAFLSSSAPLLQHWYSNSNAAAAKDPYFLYAASNAGSFLALILFPTFLERFFSLSQQIFFWHKAVIVLAIGLIACFLLGTQGSTSAATVIKRPLAPAPTRRQVLKWFALALIPSSLMLGVTTRITTDIAAISFFWVLPLAIYLATFVVSFSKYGESFARAARFVLPFIIVIAVIRFFRDDGGSFLLIATEIGIFTCVGLVLHSALYQSRPQSTRLTDFYLLVALGGCLGGLLNGLIAPKFFPGNIEYPLVLALAILIVEWTVVRSVSRIWRSAKWNGLRPVDVVVVGIISLLVSVLLIGAKDPLATTAMTGLFLTSLLAGTYAAGVAIGVRSCIGACFLVYLGALIAADLDPGVHSGRTFFGAFRVDDTITHDTAIRRFLHGTTLHGLQAKDPETALSVQSYYKILEEITKPLITASGPVSIGVTGLGAGTLACIGRPQDHITFFEIDPAVEEVARQYFTFLDKCPPKIDVVLGDARLTLGHVEDARYDILVLDAFSSDSVPVHLITNEAAMLYERVLKEDGLMVFHISNRYVDLRPILARLAEHRDWVAWEIFNEQGEDEPLEMSSSYVLASKNGLARDLLSGVDGAKPLDAPKGIRLWTDDYSNLLRILRF